jgi:ferredoxin
MGVEIETGGAKLRAVVHCQGGTSRCGDRFRYVGEQDCRAANITAGGPKKCTYGCLGFGTCAEACPFGAITMSAERLPVIDPDKCTACGICVRTCPRALISLIPADAPVYLGCSVRDRGKAVRDTCSVGCIACGLCARKDPNQAIEMVDNLPVLDFEKSGGDFYAAAEVCPQNCFVVEREPVMAGVDGRDREQDEA